MNREFTATVFIVHDGKTLLLFHKKHKKWMPPGGHMEPGETPEEAAKREVFEETGLHIEFIKQENIWFSDGPAKSIPRPHHILLEDLPATEHGPAHQHIDFIYIARPIKQHKAQETHDIRWFTPDEVQGLTAIFDDVQKTITHIFERV